MTVNGITFTIFMVFLLTLFNYFVGNNFLPEKYENKIIGPGFVYAFYIIVFNVLFFGGVFFVRRFLCFEINSFGNTFYMFMTTIFGFGSFILFVTLKYDDYRKRNPPI
jgi:hypothetical protein